MDGGIDRHHIFYEGIADIENGTYYIGWGS